MSTTPRTPKGDKYFQPSPAIEHSNPGLILLKGIAWIAVAVGAATALAMNYEVIWDVLVEAVPLVLEVAEEALDTFYEKAVRLSPGFAQMATAYTGFVLALIALYLLVRKAMSIHRKTQAAMEEWGEVYGSAWRQWAEARKMDALNWWESLDLTNKVVAVVAFILIGIPVALMVSYLLGTLVASFL